MNSLYAIDFYKVGHINQYPPGTEQVWSNFTPRYTKRKGVTSVVNFGVTAWIKEYLITAFWNEFFGRSKYDVIAEYRDIIHKTLGIPMDRIRTDHIAELWDLGHLPIRVYALPEGDSVPYGVPTLVVTNTHHRFFWLPNYLETMMSAVLWKMSTTATTAREYRRLFLQHARRSGEKDFGFIDWQGHDFSFRGQSGTVDAAMSGMGHLLSFSGTDTIPAILSAKKYYGADYSVGGSVPATEHSVMCAGGQDGEYETFRRLLTEIYPEGIVSVVSDTWDLWKVLTDYVPRLADTIKTRNGKLVIRPDSGDPVKILCGDPGMAGTPAGEGTLRLLAQALGTVDGDGLPLINKAAAIYGDSITLERADQILTRTVDELKLSPYNVVFGIGSYTYQYVTRDTDGWAMKATAVRRDGEIIPIFKKPVTDDGGKFSHRGLLAVYDYANAAYSNSVKRVRVPDYYCLQNVTEDHLDNCRFQVVFEDGELLIDPSFATIRERVRAGL